MNLNFDEISKKVKKFSKERIEDVQKLNELRVLNSQISGAKKQIRGLYAEIGKRIFEQYKEAPLDGFETEIQSIIDKMTLIEELKEKKRGLKQVVICPCCNMEVPAGEKFCSNCGNKMPETEAEADCEIVVEASDVEEMPADGEAAEEEAPAEEAAAEAAPETEAAAEEAPVEDAPEAEVVAEEAPVEDTPETNAAAEEAPAEDAPETEAAAEEAPAEETAAKEALAEDAPEAEAVAEDTPEDEAEKEDN